MIQSDQEVMMSAKGFSQDRKGRIIWTIIAGLCLVLCILSAFVMNRLIHKPEQQRTIMDVPNPIYYDTFLPLIWRAKPLPTPTTEPEYWRFLSIDTKTDIATFESTVSGQRILAKCQEHDWPVPPEGTFYHDDGTGLLIPNTNNSDGTLQQFLKQ